MRKFFAIVCAFTAIYGFADGHPVFGFIALCLGGYWVVEVIES